MAVTLDAITTLGERLDHPEGVAWDPESGSLYAGGEAGQIYRLDPATGKQEIVGETGGYVLGVALDGMGRVYACDMGRQEVVRLARGGRPEPYSRGTGEAPMRVPNHLVFDAGGSLYVSDSGEWGAANGLIYRIEPSGTTSVFTRSAPGFTNGLALSPDGHWLYVVESTLPGISRVRIRDDATAGEREVVRKMPRTVPDGIAFARDGSLYIACYRPDAVYRLTPAGDLETVVEDWAALKVAAPTNLVFYGPERTQVALACLHGEWLALFDAGRAGQPLHYPRFSSVT